MSDYAITLGGVPKHAISIYFDLSACSMSVKVLGTSRFVGIVPFEIAQSIVPLQSVVYTTGLVHPVLSAEVSDAKFSALSAKESVRYYPDMQSVLPV